MEKLNKTLKNSEKAITLIALVITVIVLLILAGISIAMLSGDNSILQKSTEARERTGIAEVVENAKLDVLAQIAENKGENISKEQLRNILKIYFDDIDSLELPDNLSNSDIKLNAKQTYGGYKNIALSKIYNGAFSTNSVANQVPDITKNKWRFTVDGEAIGIYRFDKNENAYFNGGSEPEGKYNLDGDNLTYHFVEFEWDGVKFVGTMDNGEGGTITLTLTEIIPFTFTIDSTEYTADEGMTWSEWIASDYNEGNYQIFDGVNQVFNGGSSVVYDDPQEMRFQIVVELDWIIDSTIEYYTYLESSV